MTPSNTLKGSQRKWLRGKAHDLDPVVHVGHHGVTDQVVAAIDAALLAHELIKVKLHAPEDKRAMSEEIVTRTQSELAGVVGHVLVLYRAHPEAPRIVLPA